MANKSKSALLFLLGGLMSLASCGPTSGVGGGGASTSEPGPGGNKIITVWVHKNENEDEGKVYKQIQNNFNALGLKTASGATLRMSMSFYGSTLETKISGSLMTGGLPDIIAVDSSDVASKVYSEIIVPIEDALEEGVADSYVTSVTEAGTIDGHLYWLSGMEAPGGLYYNKTMLRAAGYTDADFGTLENRWTWDDVHEAQVRLKAAGQPYQIALNEGFGSDGYMYLYSSLVYNAGGDFGSDDHVEEALTSPEALAGMRDLEQFYETDGLASNETWFYNGTASNAFTAGTIPFQIHGPWDARVIEKGSSAIKGNYGIMPYPAHEGSDEFSSPCGSFGFAVTKDSSDAAAACQALAYLTGGEAGELMYNAIGTFPTNQAKLDSMADFQNGVMKDLKDYLVANDYTRPRQAKYPRLKDAYGEVLSYMRNMNIVSNYDLEAKVREEMRDVDNARA